MKQAGPRPQLTGSAARAVAWCEYLQGHARRLYASVTDQARVAAALLAAQLTHGRLPSPFTARDVYRNEWTGLTEPRVVQGALACLEPSGGTGRERSCRGTRRPLALFGEHRAGSLFNAARRIWILSRPRSTGRR